MKRNEKILTLATALADAYKDEDDRELNCMPPIEVINGEMTEDFYCMFKAIKVIFDILSGEECDDLKFIALINRLVFQFAKRADDILDDDEDY